MHINIIGVPLTYGCGKFGADMGPDALRMENISALITNSGLKVYDLGNIHVPDLAVGDKYRGHDHLKYLDHIIKVNENLAEQVYISMKAGNFPFIIGGDHALAIGSIAGASAYHNNLKDFAVIWVDAHTDINTEKTSPTGNIHGMPLAASMNEGIDSLTNLYYDGMKVDPRNIYIVGARDIDDGEYIIAEKTGLNLYEMEDIKNIGLEKTMEEILNQIKKSGINNVHFSFDIDSLDPSFIPGTGTPVKGGFTLEEGKYIISKVLNENIVKSMDFVELNPTLDKSDKTIENCMELLKTTFNSLDLKKL